MPRIQNNKHTQIDGRAFTTGAVPDARRLLCWYDDNRRDLAWRAPPGQRQDPYRVWLSEVMLQQTTVAVVDGYYRKFLRRWPRVEDLAAADRDDVLAEWAGLGYYARARNLHECARRIVADYGGVFPETPLRLKELPGIGDYTAAAIAAIAFDRPEAAVDGNIERLLARLYCLDEQGPALKRQVRTRLEPLMPKDRPGDFIQALMDLGATVCSPRNPACPTCPWRSCCKAQVRGLQEAYPKKSAGRAKPRRHGMVFWLEAEGRILFRRRPEHGLLGGMLEMPGSPWSTGQIPRDLSGLRRHAPADADWQVLPGHVRHSFTHFHLDLKVARAHVATADRLDGLWLAPDEIDAHAVPAVMMKVVRYALSHAGD